MNFVIKPKKKELSFTVGNEPIPYCVCRRQGGGGNRKKNRDQQTSFDAEFNLITRQKDGMNKHAMFTHR